MPPTDHRPKGRYSSFESILHKMLHQRLESIIDERCANLGNGSAAKDNVAATAAAYHEAIGGIRALRDCQQICDEIAVDLTRDG